MSTARRRATIAVALIPVNLLVWLGAAFADSRGPAEALQNTFLALFTLIAIAQAVYGIGAVLAGYRERARGSMVTGGLALVGAGLGWIGGMGILALGSMGGAWGRPLRVRGRQLHPSLRRGADWTAGPRPDPRGLDEPTRRALEALWLHDAQKEHASVPAFARVSWLLASVGAPAELLTWSHRAAIEEIEHTRACFALAAGYGGRTFTVEPMPDLVLATFDDVDPRITLAIESLGDGCQLEDFNADVAAACAEACEEPVTRSVLETIAREERGHADFSWAVLDWLLATHRSVVEGALVTALDDLATYPRPTAVSDDKRLLVDRADPARLRLHGRLPDATWAALWDARLVETRRRAQQRLARVAA